MKFTLNEPVRIEESLTCEFKEVVTGALQTIAKAVDAYIVSFLIEDGGSIYWGIRDHDRVVTAVSVSDKQKDELRQVIGQKVSAIAPSVAASSIKVPFHQVSDSRGSLIEGRYVVEVCVDRPSTRRLYVTGSGEVYKRMLGGTKKLGGAELILALMESAQSERSTQPVSAVHLEKFPKIVRRAEVVAPLIRGRRVLWVDDNPRSTLYERLALSELGVHVDVATSTEDAINACRLVPPDVVISDIERQGNNHAGLELLEQLRRAEFGSPVVFYIGVLDPGRGVPPGAFGITNEADEVLHLTFDALERSP